jgi:hypothetical protein
MPDDHNLGPPGHRDDEGGRSPEPAAAEEVAARSRYLAGCRCDECKYAQSTYQRRYRERKANGLTRPLSPVVVAEVPQAEAGRVPDGTPGPVESAVKDEIGASPQRHVPAWRKSRFVWPGCSTTRKQ